MTFAWDSRSAFRIEWGHRLASDFPDRERYRDAEGVRPCMDSVFREPRAEPCGDKPMSNGFPQDHLWRLVSVSEWQTSKPDDLEQIKILDGMREQILKRRVARREAAEALAADPGGDAEMTR